jgi:UDP-2,4-diacetamido-2,4,6-trideoxy-beta-L-altropyranose hydrolase
MRCLTLGDALRALGSQVCFVSAEITDSLAALIRFRGHESVRLQPLPPAGQEADARQTLEALGGRRFDWLVVDHYGLDAAWEQVLRPAAQHILIIDDLADRPHDCDLLLDQNLYTNPEARYAGLVPEPCRLLLGPRYALLREEFAKARANTHVRRGPVNRILVFFGGGDATNQTAVALEALLRLKARCAVDVVIGAEHAARGQIERVCRDNGFQLHVHTARMAELMSAADLAIGAGGSATWERCCLGLPSLVISVAANQDRVVHDGALAGFVYAPGEVASEPERLARHVQSLIENPLLRQAMSRKAMEMVDGRGTSRVLPALGVSRVSLRTAVAADSDNLFEWRNHLSIRRVSRSGALLERAAHERWLRGVLGDPARVLLVGEAHGQAVGVVRFDTRDSVAEVSIYVVPGREGSGLGAELLAAAEGWLGSHRRHIREIRAEVLAANQPSHRLFSGAGYQLEATIYRKRMD